MCWQHEKKHHTTSEARSLHKRRATVKNIFLPHDQKYISSSVSLIPAQLDKGTVLSPIFLHSRKLGLSSPGVIFLAPPRSPSWHPQVDTAMESEMRKTTSSALVTFAVVALLIITKKSLMVQAPNTSCNQTLPPSVFRECENKDLCSVANASSLGETCHLLINFNSSDRNRSFAELG